MNAKIIIEPELIPDEVKCDLAAATLAFVANIKSTEEGRAALIRKTKEREGHREN